MATEKVSATLDRKVIQEIRKLAGSRGVSAFLNEAAKARLRQARIRAYLDDLDRMHGPPDESTKQEARKRVARALGA